MCSRPRVRAEWIALCLVDVVWRPAACEGRGRMGGQVATLVESNENCFV